MLWKKGAAHLVDDAEVMSGGAGLATRPGARCWKLDEALGYRRFCCVKPRLPITVRELQTMVRKYRQSNQKVYLAKNRIS